MSERLYYKRNVTYTIGVRLFPGDWNGVALTTENPYVGIDVDKVKDFKRANKSLFERGMIIQIDEPSTDFENANMISDEKASELVKNIFKLKKVLQEITSVSTVVKLLEEAKEQNRPDKTMEMLKVRLSELSDETPLIMRGVE